MDADSFLAKEEAGSKTDIMHRKSGYFNSGLILHFLSIITNVLKTFFPCWDLGTAKHVLIKVLREDNNVTKLKRFFNLRPLS